MKVKSVDVIIHRIADIRTKLSKISSVRRGVTEFSLDLQKDLG